ncbi:putative B3 domain-containing protein At5g58280 [Cornus florida]|uniref:putative B3 domain-containing protein At5g58280 n=1 Tax=Cornus florida TaxID=4283 RepID=UPI0028A105B3|nr:putative B3 domain-containing protein At5g58280 [Cornus florida]
MANEEITNTYEEVRKQRLQDNKKRFEDLGILKISRSLSDIKKSEKKPQQRHTKPLSGSAYLLEPRRSSRARNPVPSYRDEVDIGLPPLRKRSKFNSSWASYLARPLNEVKSASYEERARAFRFAEKLQSNLQSENPSFVKSMVRSHVYSCFWLGLPSKFCEEHLPKSTIEIALEDENGAEYEAIYIGARVGLSGGWRAFALDHKLDDGDALVFELIEPSRFKVYIVKASRRSRQEDDVPIVNKTETDAEKASDAEAPASDTQPRRSTRAKKNENSSQIAAKKRNRR